MQGQELHAPRAFSREQHWRTCALLIATCLLSFARAAKAKALRGAWQPTFNPSTLAEYSATMNERAAKLLTRLSTAEGEGKEVNIWRLFGDMTFDVVGSTAFGYAPPLARIICKQQCHRSPAAVPLFAVAGPDVWKRNPLTGSNSTPRIPNPRSQTQTPPRASWPHVQLSSAMVTAWDGFLPPTPTPPQSRPPSLYLTLLCVRINRGDRAGRCASYDRHDDADSRSGGEAAGTWA